jgi:hypothetical protein
VLVAQPGKFYTLEGCVSTTATYGDTFRVITRTRCCQREGFSMLSCMLEFRLHGWSTAHRSLSAAAGHRCIPPVHWAPMAALRAAADTAQEALTADRSV